MAVTTNAISASLSFSAAVSGATASLSVSKSFDMTNSDMGQGTGVVSSTTPVAISLGAATGNVRLIVKNIDPTTNLLLSLSGSVATQVFATIAPGDFCYVPTNGVTTYIAAASAVATNYFACYCEL